MNDSNNPSTSGMNPNAGSDLPLADRRGVALVVLDWAGTLIDHGSCAPVKAFVAAFAEHGVTISQEQARAPMGMAKRAHIHAIAQEPSVAADWQGQHGRAFSEDDIDAIYASFLPVQRGCIVESSLPIEGVAEAVSTLRERGIRLGSSTGYTRELMDQVQPRAEAAGILMDAVFTATEVPNGRPHPWLIYENMRRLNVYPPRCVVKVDDTTAGVRAGVNAGAWSIGVAATGNVIGLDAEAFAALSPDERTERVAAARETLREAGAHEVIDSVAELPGLIEKLDPMIMDGMMPGVLHEQFV